MIKPAKRNDTKYYCCVLITIFLITARNSAAHANSGAILQKGMVGAEVLILQQDMERLGFFHETPTGYFGEMTQNAVIAFQKKYKLTSDGVVGINTRMQIERLLESMDKSMKAKIVIDAGHGGIDSGTILGKEKESKITLSISKKLQKCLMQEPCRVYMTRQKDTSLSELSSIGDTLQRRDLNARTNVFNKSGADLFVSIHVNSNPDCPNLSGSVVYYNGNLPQSRLLAQCLQKELNNITLDGKKRKFNQSETSDFYILENSNIPGVLVETAYVTNKQERRLLSTDSFRNKVAVAITKGIDNYFFLYTLAKQADVNCSHAARPAPEHAFPTFQELEHENTGLKKAGRSSGGCMLGRSGADSLFRRRSNAASWNLNLCHGRHRR